LDGEYTLVYSATDSDEATGYATRTVIVLPQLDGSGGTNGTPGCKDPKASNYDPSAVYDGTCTYAPAGEVLGASTSTVPATGTTTPQGEVLGASTSTEPLTCGEYLTLTDSLGKKYLKEGIRNDKNAVMLLQKFLNEQLGLSLPVTGYFGPLTTKAVKTFQLLHKDTVLTPWGLTKPTGIVYKTTIARINNLKCSTLNIVIDTKDLR
jgi:peptidoglycan hydrolase-like protein with peptidoglycan-binding domain